MYEFWIEADNYFNIFSLYGRERDKYTESGTAGQRDKYTESGTAGQIIRKRDCPAVRGTVGMYVPCTFRTSLFLFRSEVSVLISPATVVLT